MKLRIQGDSIRLRLTQSEVAAVGQGGAVVETTHFPNGLRMGYSLCSSDVSAMSVDFRDQTITIALPNSMAQRWAGSNEVSLRESVTTDAGTLALLVEKDFECLEPRAGQDSDAFPNPNASA